MTEAFGRAAGTRLLLYHGVQVASKGKAPRGTYLLQTLFQEHPHAKSGGFVKVRRLPRYSTWNLSPGKRAAFMGASADIFVASNEPRHGPLPLLVMSSESLGGCQSESSRSLEICGTMTRGEVARERREWLHKEDYVCASIKRRRAALNAGWWQCRIQKVSCTPKTGIARSTKVSR